MEIKNPDKYRDLEKLINSISDEGDVSAITMRKMADVFARCTLEFIESIDRSSKSNKRLSKRIYWLNIILTAATVVMAVTAILGLLAGDAGNNLWMIFKSIGVK